MNKLYRNIAVILFIGFSFFNGHSQSYFEMPPGVKKQTMSFKLLSNLIVLPIEVNGTEMNFILDSGVGATILFNLDARDSLSLKNVKSMKLRGLGSEEPVEAILSTGNEFKLNKLRGLNQNVYVVFNDNFDLSSKMGITIHGIIGYELLKNYTVKIQYGSKRITFYNNDEFDYSKCNKCEFFDLDFYKLKPYINIGVQLDSVSDRVTDVKLLIDSGGSDAMWLFENSKPELGAPVNYFKDFLGEGLSGAIYGKRTKIKGMYLGNFYLNGPTVSYPDSSSVSFARQYKERNGSIGASILKRFIVVFDYKNKKLSLKKGNMFKDPFRYNMSGIELVYNGKVMVRERDKKTYSLADGQRASGKTEISLAYRYKFSFKNSYRIFKVSEGSPADLAGLQKDDIIIKINGDYTHSLKFDEIVSMFFKKENTRISLVIERNGQNYEYRFRLKDLLK